MAVRRSGLLTRRKFLTTAAAAGAIGSIARPYLSRAADRPLITHGIQSGRRLDRFRRGLGARRPARADAGRGRHHRQLQATSASACCVDALPESDFTAKALLEDLPAGQDIFYRVRFEDLSSPTHRRARRRSAASAPRRTTGATVSFVWSGDTAGQGWGIDEARGGMRTYATMLRQPAGLLHPFRRQHLCRLPDRARAEAAERRNLAQRRHRGEVARRRDARRLSRQLQIQPARREPARLQRRGARCSRNGTTTRSPTTGGRAAPPIDDRLRRDSARCWPRAAAARSANSCRCGRRRPRPAASIARSSYGPLLDVFLLDMRSYRGAERSTATTRRSIRPAGFLGPRRLAWLKRELAALERDLEGDRRRHADRRRQPGCHRAGRRPAARPRARDRRAAVVHQARGRRATRCGSPPTCTTPPRTTTIRTARCSRTSSRSGSSSPARSTPAPGRRGRSTTRSDRRVMYQNGCSAEQGENLAPCFGLQFFGHVAIDGDTEVMTVTLKDVERPRPVVDADRAEGDALDQRAGGAAI